jgi:ribonuclease HII
VTIDVRRPPSGLRDSKLLTPAARQALVPRIKRWVPQHVVAHSSAEEIDRLGILRALRLAGERALAGLPARPDCVLLDGSYDWLTRPAPTLFDDDVLDVEPVEPPKVITLIKADLRCAAVAAASVLAKTVRDALMVELALEHPGYGWEMNKGYAAPDHYAGLRALGPCAQHRRSWRPFRSDSDSMEPESMDFESIKFESMEFESMEMDGEQNGYLMGDLADADLQGADPEDAELDAVDLEELLA